MIIEFIRSPYAPALSVMAWLAAMNFLFWLDIRLLQGRGSIRNGNKFEPEWITLARYLILFSVATAALFFSVLSLSLWLDNLFLGIIFAVQTFATLALLAPVSYLSYKVWYWPKSALDFADRFKT